MNIYYEATDDSGYIIRKEWNYCHPSGHAGLVIEHFDPYGQLQYRQFGVDGELSRPVSDGPAVEAFYKSGQLDYLYFYVDGKKHRPIADGPAYESFHESGVPRCRIFYVDGIAVPHYENILNWQFSEIAARPMGRR